MVTIIKTGDRESDLIHLHGLLAQVGKSQILRYDATEQRQLNSFLGALQTISFLKDATLYVVEGLELSKGVLELLTQSEKSVIVVSPTGRGKITSGKTMTLIDTVYTDQALKTKLSGLLSKLQLNLSRDELLQLQHTITVTDSYGKEKLSPVLYTILERRLLALTQDARESPTAIIKELIKTSMPLVNHWDILTNLFSPNKAKQHAYFSELSELISPYEIINNAKTTLSLALLILIGKQEHIDPTSIAQKIGKHPFYVGSIARTIQERSITPAQGIKMLTRLMNLELALKSGKFDDEQFGFEVLLATL